MGLKRQQRDDDPPPCPFRLCGEDANTYIDELWLLDRIGQPAQILVCEQHAKRFALWLDLQRQRPAPMQYRTAPDVGQPMSEWKRLPQTILFQIEDRPRMVEFRKMPTPPPAPGPLEMPEEEKP